MTRAWKDRHAFRDDTLSVVRLAFLGPMGNRCGPSKEYELSSEGDWQAGDGGVIRVEHVALTWGEG